MLHELSDPMAVVTTALHAAVHEGQRLSGPQRSHVLEEALRSAVAVTRLVHRARDVGYLRSDIAALEGVRSVRVLGELGSRTGFLVVIDASVSRETLKAKVLELAADRGLDLDPRAVTMTTARPLRSRRPKLSGCSISLMADLFSAEVRLEHDNGILTGTSFAIDPQGTDERSSVVRATLAALHDLLDPSLAVSKVDIVRVGPARLAAVILDGAGGQISGTAIVRSDIYEAVARATLDAVNRWITAPETREASAV